MIGIFGAFRENKSRKKVGKSRKVADTMDIIPKKMR